MTYRDEFERWLLSPTIDEDSKAELRSIADDDGELRSRFLSFM